MPNRSRSPRRRSPSPPRRRRDSPDYKRGPDAPKEIRVEERDRERDRDRDRERDRERDRDRDRSDRDGAGPSGRPDYDRGRRRSPSPPRRARSPLPPRAAGRDEGGAGGSNRAFGDLPPPPPLPTGADADRARMPPPPPPPFGGADRGGGGGGFGGGGRGDGGGYGGGGGGGYGGGGGFGGGGGGGFGGGGGGGFGGGGYGGGGGGRDGRDLPTSFGRQQDFGGNPDFGGDGDVSDEDIRAKALGNFQEYRRLKRVKLAERNIKPFWRATPSPPASANYKVEIPKDYVLLLGAAAVSTHAPPAHHHGNGDKKDGKEGAKPKPQVPAPGPAAALFAATEPPSDKQLLALDQEEAEVFRQWLEHQRAMDAEAERQRREAAAAEGGGGDWGGEDDVGPQLPGEHRGQSGAGGNFGGFLRPGEGERMAAYVASGKRIPRRGEVGLSSDQIERFEGLGYIMSGSRHSRMNAIRMRKENQIYTAEEKAALAMFNYEENKRKEAKVLEDMTALVTRTLAVHGGVEPGMEGPPPPEPGA